MPSSVQEKKGPPIHMLKVLRIPEHQEYRNPFPEKSMTSHGFLTGQKASDPVSGTLKAWSSEPTAAAGWTQCQRNSEGEAGPCPFQERRFVTDGHAKAHVILGELVCHQSQALWLSGDPLLQLPPSGSYLTVPHPPERQVCTCGLLLTGQETPGGLPGWN